ncbi:biotin biosynthesis protein BioC [Variovorax sp. PBS-H4]|uniref:tetratricopeptide repeat protein n=1 Tax=Variovorax sp. PBS-H4 TaxID=434008 RepID=UPI001317B775|nr:tetratricopeptide repeat protein [Variovorax sp. PBS-H4]VTU40830.1 biotin biosynthesis protein BioC [Variovorax sp. PBS-H4]
MSNPSHAIVQPTPPADPFDPALEWVLARKLHEAGRFDEAEQAYERVLAAVPEHADALHFTGLAAHQRGDHARAIALIRAAIALDGEQFGWYINLGNVLLLAEQPDAAGEAYEEALRLAPERADIHNNLGVFLTERGRLAQSESTLRRAVALDPGRAEIHANLGRVLLRLSRSQEARSCLDEALRLDPELTLARPLLALIYRRLGRLDAAAQVYREWLARDPDDPTALHHLAGCSGEAVPERAAEAYVERTFNAFASTFDKTLEKLAYRGPAQLAEAARQRLGEPGGALDVLDAGCGTGLCGPLIAPYARHLAGVDLSQPMLDKARLREVYDTLTKAELTAFLEDAEPASCDLIVSADVLIYFGALDRCFQAAAKVLRPGGWLFFTVEALAGEEGTGFQLHAHGRYSHCEGYLRQALAAADLMVEGLERAHLRVEAGQPVEGWVVSCRKEPLAP